MDCVLRIAYLSSACIPSRTANSIHVMKMSQAMARAGHEVRLFAPDKAQGREQNVEDTFSYYGVEANFDLEYGPWLALRGRGYWYGWQAARRVARWGVDLAYGRNLAACCFAAVHGIPVTLEAHAPIEESGPVARFLLGRLARSPKLRRLVVITHELRAHYERHWPVLQGRIMVAPDGADPLLPNAAPVALGGREGCLQVGYTGHLYKGKGAELVAELARLCPEYDFHIVGGTPTDLCRWRSRTDRPRNLYLHGYRPPKDVPGYILSFDVALLPNQPAVHAHGGIRDIGRWTSPLKLFEYMAAGRAIVCSDTAVLREVARDGENALVCRHDDVTEWVAVLRRLENEPDLRRSLGEIARKQLENEYCWDVRAKAVLEV